MRLRHASMAILRNNGNVLLLKRGEHRKIAPGFWSGPGGHFKEYEMNSPYDACYRELEEETGISKKFILSLNLKYLLLRRYKDEEIRLSYIFFGETSQTELRQTDEGQLYWIPETEMLEKQFTPTFTAMLEHNLKRKPDDQAVYIGVADKDNGKLRMHWAPCKDFE